MTTKSSEESRQGRIPGGYGLALYLKGWVRFAKTRRMAHKY